MRALLISITIGMGLVALAAAEDWLQLGQNPQHTGNPQVIGQKPARILANLVYDPFVSQAQAEEGGELLVHYQTPLVQGQDVFMEFKSGKYVNCNPPGTYEPYPCGPDNWNNQVWSEERLHWEGGSLVTKWEWASDWKPEPDASGELGDWEPVFHAAVAEDYVYVPGFGGTVWKLNQGSGQVVAHINPFGSAVDPNIFVSGPLTADSQGNIYYNALKLSITNSQSTNDPWSYGPNFDGQNAADIPGAWLVKIGADGSTHMTSYKTLISTAPTTCETTFAYDGAPLPWPPSPTAQVQSTVPCLSQRPGVNIAPAIAPDGTIYSVSVAHNPYASRFAYVIAFHPDLTLKWAASLRGLLHDGCNGVLPQNGTLGGCRLGATPGVDPATNEPPAGRVIDQSTSSPVVTPDGGVLYGAYTIYNFARGHLFRFSATGQFLGAYDFGWDTTPAVYQHNGTFSIVLKDNHYDASSYCSDPNFCPVAPPGPYYITQLNPSMTPEWKFQNNNTQSCSRNPDGTLSCVSDHPNGFEWCINAPAVDAIGNVYANSEDGNLYVIPQGGKSAATIFMNLAIGAAYTPLSLGPDGKIYTQNDGRLFVIGN
ncbi:MAG TPA: hypothetical protein VKB88_06550 [Bryobacteraceae bacterium]|nr:hypothetical protein [Bryobacteraceae bacterium]